MSFDPITLAMSKPKVIDIVKDATTLADAMLNFFLKGEQKGSTTINEPMDSFFAQFKKEHSIVALDLTVLGDLLPANLRVKLVTQDVCVIKDTTGEVMCVSFVLALVQHPVVQKLEYYVINHPSIGAVVNYVMSQTDVTA